MSMDDVFAILGIAPAAAPTTQVKICGLRDTDTALAAAEAGADMIGFVFAPSKRRVEPEAAAAIIEAVRHQYGADAPLMVGLFVNETPERMSEIAHLCDLDLIQLSGDEAPNATLLASLDIPVIRVLRVPVDTTLDQVLSQVDLWRQAEAAAGDGVVGPWGSRLLIGLDAYHPGAYGGTGQQADHDLAAIMAIMFPLMLAGGLIPSNVAATIDSVTPWAVDVSSGVEEGGAKSPALIREFIAAAKPGAAARVKRDA